MKQYIMSKLTRLINYFKKTIRLSGERLTVILAADVYFGRNMADLPAGSIVFLPYRENIFCCGIAALVSYKQKKSTAAPQKITLLNEVISRIGDQGFDSCHKADFSGIDDQYLGGQPRVESLWQAVQRLKSENHFFGLYMDSKDQANLENLSNRLNTIIATEAQMMADHIGRMPLQSVELMTARIEKLKDIAWCINNEILDNISHIKDLCRGLSQPPKPETIGVFKKVNAVLNSIDRLEVRGRDSAGISLLFILKATEFDKFEKTLKQANNYSRLENRCGQNTL